MTANEFAGLITAVCAVGGTLLTLLWRSASNVQKMLDKIESFAHDHQDLARRFCVHEDDEHLHPRATLAALVARTDAFEHEVISRLGRIETMLNGVRPASK